MSRSFSYMQYLVIPLLAAATIMLGISYFHPAAVSLPVIAGLYSLGFCSVFCTLWNH